MLPLLQDAGHATLNVVLPAVVQAAALALLIGAIDLTLGRRLRASLRQALWLLVVLKLILPPSLELPTSAAYWIGRLTLKPREIRAVSGLPPGLSATWEMVPSQPPPLAPLHSYQFQKPTDPSSLLLLLWITGSALLAAVIFRRQRRVQNLLNSATPPTPALDALLTQASTEAGLSRRPQLLLTSENHSPAVCGLLHPTLLLPRSLVDAVSPEVLRNVLLHELIHIRRRDLWVNALQVGVQVLWWWNPIAWFANARVRALRELAVDEQVQHLHGPQNPTAYPAALVEVARHCSAQPMLALSFVGILESNRTLKQRVERLLTHPTPTRPQLGGSGWITILALALLVVPMGFSPRVRIVAANNPTPAPAVGASNVLQIECLSGGRFQLGDQVLDLAALTEELKRRSAAAPDLVLSLRSAPDAPMAGILDVVKAAQAVGITRINIQSVPASARPDSSAPGATTPVPYSGREEIEAALASVKLSGLRFVATPLPEVIEELDARSRAADPTGRGFHFINLFEPTGKGYAPRITWQQPTGELTVSEILIRIVLNSDRELRRDTEDYAVVFRSPSVSTSPLLFTRRFKMSRRVLVQNLERKLGKPIGTNAPDAGAALRTFLSQHRLSFADSPSEATPPQNQPAMFYNDRTGELFVRATDANHAKLEAILDKFSGPPVQIELTAQIIEVVGNDWDRVSQVLRTQAFYSSTNDPIEFVAHRPEFAQNLTHQLRTVSGVSSGTAMKLTTLHRRPTSVQLRCPTSKDEVSVGITPSVDDTSNMIELEMDGFESWAQINSQELFAGLFTGNPSKRYENSYLTKHCTIRDQDTLTLISAGKTLPDGTQRYRILMITPTLIDMAGHPVNPKL